MSRLDSLDSKYAQVEPRAVDVPSLRRVMYAPASIHGHKKNVSGISEMSRYRAVLWCVVLSCALSLPWLGRPFHTRGEPREALVAQAMLDTGNWISPPAYDGAVPSKPPFSHWLISLASLPAGHVSEVSARLPSALAFILFSAGFCAFLASRVSPQVALSVVLVLLASFEWLRAASTCRVDTILATSMAGGMLALFAWWERGCRGLPWLAFALISMSALTKGPVGIVLPVGIFALFSWVRAGCTWAAIIPIAIRCLTLAVAAAAVVAIWYVLGYLERGEEFIAKIRYENIERFTSSMQDEPHKHSMWYLCGMLGVGLLPWSVFWLSAHLRIRMPNKENWPTIKAIKEWYRGLPDLYQFSALVSVCVVGFFCIPASKRSVYVLPAFPFLALLLERALRDWLRARPEAIRKGSQLFVALVIALVLGTFGLMIVTIGYLGLSWSAFVESLTTLKVVSCSGLIVSCVWLVRGESSRFWREPLSQIALAIIVGTALGSFVSYDTAAHQISVREWVRSPQFASVVRPGIRTKMYSFGVEAYGASFYLHKPFSRLTGRVEPGAVVFLERRKLPELSALIGVQVKELSHHASGLDKPGRDTVVVEVAQ